MLSEIQIELMGICNATCCYCTWQQRTTGKQAMQTELAHKLLDAAVAINPAMVIRYHGLGESLLHPDLLSIIEYGEQLGLNHSLSTNCFNLHGELATRLSRYTSLHLILAIPWVMRETFVEVSVANAVAYIKNGFANKRVHAQMVCHRDAMKYYDRCIDTFLPLVESTPAYLHLKQPVTWPNDTPNHGFIDHKLQRHHKVIFDRRATPLSIGVGCTMPERFLMIQADGTCVPCCVGMDEWGLGKVQDSSLADIWNSVEMQTIRDKWQRGDDSIPCGHCKKRTDCLQHVQEL